MTSATGTSACPAWEAQLAAQRGTLNAILATARSAGAPVDVLRTAVLELGTAVEPLVAALSPARADVTCRALVELVSDLVVRKAWHARAAERWAVLSVLPRLPRAMDRSARTAIGVVVHGAARIARETDLEAWGARLAAADPFLADDAELRAGAAVAAWRSGLVRSRVSALAAAAAFGTTGSGTEPATEALRALLDLPGAPLAALAANAAAPFSWPGAVDRGTAATYGGYRAFGGPWTGVPVVLGALDAPTPTWRVLADGIPWVVVADVHGHAVLREPSGLAPTLGSWSTTPAGTVPWPPPPAVARVISTLVAWEDEITGAWPAAGPQGSSVRPVLVSRASSYRLDLVLVCS